VVLRDDLERVDAAQGLWAAGVGVGADADERDDAREALDERVRDAVAAALTKRQRLLVELHFFQGLSQGEIARRLGVAQQVVQKQLYGVQRHGRRVGGALPRLREALRPVARELGLRVEVLPAPRGEAPER
jgi:DNA-directed RNA polymerase specialized sigma24 family protein